MVKKEKLDDKQLADLLTAQMGLATQEVQKQEKAEGCLSSDELANIAANLCTPEQKEKAVEHFSGCKACYDEWVSICFSLAAMESGSSSGRMPVVTVRNIGYIGSALAIAACVVLFINLRQDLTLQEDGIMRPRQEKTEVQGSSPARKAVDNRARSAEGAGGPEKKADFSAAGRTQPEPPPTAEKRQAPSAPQPAVLAESTASEDSDKEITLEEAVVEQEVVASAAVPGEMDIVGATEDWIGRLEEACLVSQHDATFWIGLHDEGRELLNSLEKNRPGDEELRRLMGRLLKLTPDSDDPALIEAQCGALGTLLDNSGRKE